MVGKELIEGEIGKDIIPGKLIPLGTLRWRNGILEQGFRNLAGAPDYWVPVPTVND